MTAIIDPRAAVHNPALAVAVGPELVIGDLLVDDAAAAIEQLGQLLVAHGHVRSEYIAAAIERERELPTGLPTVPIGVALPHADPEAVLRPAIAVGRLVVPVTFGEMGTPENGVQVRLVFLLALSSKQQATVLSDLVVAFQRPGFLESLVGAPDAAEIAAALHAVLTTLAA